MNGFLPDSQLLRFIVLPLLWYGAATFAYLIAKNLRAPLLSCLVYLFTLAWLAGASYAIVMLPPIDIAKLALVNIMGAVSLIAFTVFAFSRQIERELRCMEKDCDLLRDYTLFQANDLRAQLNAVKERLAASDEPPAREEVIANVIKGVSPIVMLAFQKDRSIVKWTLAAFNIARTLTKHLRKTHTVSGQ